MADPTVEEQISTVVSAATKGDDGTFSLGEEALKDVPEAIAHAAKSEVRHKNTQSAYTKSQQELSKTKKVAVGLTEELAKNAPIKLTAEQSTELETLKKDDPDAWRVKLNEYENTASDSLVETIAEIDKNSANATELELRTDKLAAFEKDTGLELNDDVIANQLPANYMKDFESGKTTYDEFLVNAKTFLTKTKVIEGAGEGSEADNEIDMAKMGGRSDPSESAKNGDIVDNYKNTIF